MMESVAKQLTLDLLRTTVISCLLAPFVAYALDAGWIVGTFIFMAQPLLGILSTTCYLNLLPQVRNNVYLSAASFFAPALLSFPLAFPFLLLHIWSFITFRYKLKGESLPRSLRVAGILTSVFFFVALVAIFCLTRYNHPSNSKYFQGIVVDQQRQPVFGAKVHVLETDPGADTIVYTNPNGYFKLPTEGSRGPELVVEYPGYCSDTLLTRWIQHGEIISYSFRNTADTCVLRKQVVE